MMSEEVITYEFNRELLRDELKKIKKNNFKKIKKTDDFS